MLVSERVSRLMLNHEQIVFIALGLESDSNIFVKAYTPIVCFFFLMQSRNDIPRISGENGKSTVLIVPVWFSDMNMAGGLRFSLSFSREWDDTTDRICTENEPQETH